ncbi:hypothetical protein COCVIDRAFT_21299 [Bipolaris victoriae FI3]|uniref:Uncharacterized protein n=1 Tax=Bipolaris victoriae (strain FI3) TaxID=930091 RepID=W7E3R1_BIPV3|nr:hypothetical protein COCVIDRAFT_21299 [Bipolaris victoriae FI3]
MVYILGDRHLVTWEYTRVMLMFLRCLQFSYTGGLIQKVSGCWQDVRCHPSTSEPDGIQRLEGLGFRDTMSQYGYAWFLDKARSYALLSLLVDICLRAFRKDVFQHIRLIIRRRYRAPALSGDIALCRPIMEKIVKPTHLPLHFVSGNRVSVKTIGALCRWLWDWEDGTFLRRHWSDKPHRMLYWRCIYMIGIINGPAQAQLWRLNLERRFIQTHWIVPYSESSCFFSRTKKHQYCWWSSYHNNLTESFTVSSAKYCSIAEVAELSTDGWRSSLEALQLEMKMLKIPKEVEMFLQTLLPIEIEGTLPFPVLKPPVHGYNVRSSAQHQRRKQYNKNWQWLDHYLTTFAHAQETGERVQHLAQSQQP